MLREAGRWLAVLHVNRLRSALLRRGQERGLDGTDVFFHTFEEISANELHAATAAKRRDERRRHEVLVFPQRIGTFIAEVSPTKPLGVSPGRASGTLLRELPTPGAAGAKPILYVDLLTPDLVDSFGLVAGIIAAQGGLLSHLAIVAREQGIPVIVGARLHDGPLVIGQRIEMDGSTAEIRLSKAEEPTGMR